jgi:hypothetical protein
MVICVDAARVWNAIFLEYVTGEMALEKAVIGCTDPNIPIDNH